MSYFSSMAKLICPVNSNSYRFIGNSGVLCRLEDILACCCEPIRNKKINKASQSLLKRFKLYLLFHCLHSGTVAFSALSTKALPVKLQTIFKFKTTKLKNLTGRQVQGFLSCVKRNYGKLKKNPGGTVCVSLLLSIESHSVWTLLGQFYSSVHHN